MLRQITSAVSALSIVLSIAPIVSAAVIQAKTPALSLPAQSIAYCWIEYRDGQGYRVCGNPCTVHNCGTRNTGVEPAIALIPITFVPPTDNPCPKRTVGTPRLM